MKRNTYFNITDFSYIYSLVTINQILVLVIKKKMLNETIFK